MFVSRHLKTALPTLLVVMLALTAYFEAEGVNQLVAAEVVGTVAMVPQLAAVEVSQPTALDGDDVLARNPFDSKTGSLLAGAIGPDASDVAGGEEPVATGPSVADPACDFGRVLLISAAEREQDSFATIEKAPHQASLYRQGDEVEGRTVAAISWDRVWLEDSGAHCQLKLGGKSLGAGRAGARKAKAGRGKRGGLSERHVRSRRALDPALAAKISRISDTEIHIERSLVDSLLADPNGLTGLVRGVRPRRGERGVRLLGVRADSLLGQLGLKNGDRVSSVNGFEVSDPKAMLTAYGMLQRAEALSVRLQRDGKPLTINVLIK